MMAISQHTSMTLQQHDYCKLLFWIDQSVTLAAHITRITWEIRSGRAKFKYDNMQTGTRMIPT